MSVAKHLEDRHVADGLYSVYTDEVEGVATFLLRDGIGALTGYQQYRPDAGKEKKNHPREGRYFTYKTAGRIAVFGMETFGWSRPLFITEGIFDCVRLHNEGLSSLALLSNDPKGLRQWLWTLQRPIYAVCDSGSPGIKMAKLAHRYWVCENGDLGSMTEDEVSHIVQQFGYIERFTSPPSSASSSSPAFLRSERSPDQR